jgi:hypothetical protein
MSLAFPAPFRYSGGTKKRHSERRVPHEEGSHILMIAALLLPTAPSAKAAVPSPSTIRAGSGDSRDHRIPEGDVTDKLPMY